jgi:hypothetical protein
MHALFLHIQLLWHVHFYSLPVRNAPSLLGAGTNTDTANMSATRLDSLTNELFENMVERLDLQDLRNLRMVSKAVAFKATQHHFASYFETLDPNLEIAAISQWKSRQSYMRHLSQAEPFPNLRKLQPGGLSLSIDDLLEFLRNHDASLREISLENVQAAGSLFAPLFEFLASQDCAVERTHLKDLQEYFRMLMFLPEQGSQFTRFSGATRQLNVIDRWGADVKLVIGCYLSTDEEVEDGRDRRSFPCKQVERSRFWVYSRLAFHVGKSDMEGRWVWSIGTINAESEYLTVTCAKANALQHSDSSRDILLFTIEKMQANRNRESHWRWWPTLLRGILVCTIDHIQRNERKQTLCIRSHATFRKQKHRRSTTPATSKTKTISKTATSHTIHTDLPPPARRSPPLQRRPSRRPRTLPTSRPVPSPWRIPPEGVGKPVAQLI